MVDIHRLTCICMHVHDRAMRTTIEISDKHRAELLRIAGKRGEKGFSTVIGEAIAFFLEQVHQRDENVKSALLLRGTLTSKEARDLETSVKAIRERWR